MSEGSIEDLLARLSTGRIDSAWREFLERYSPLIMHVVRRYESDQGQVTDCYLHACSELSNDSFRRLLRYRADGAAKFQTWLSVVVVNLCIDWRRKQNGRFRLAKAITNLPEIDQLVYRQIYIRGMSRQGCLHSLLARFPTLTEQQVAEINARLFSLLKPQQRWHLSVRSVDGVSLDQSPWDETDEELGQVEDPGTRPDEQSEMEQQFRRLEVAMAKLPAPQRLMLRLRYEQNLTLEEVARLMRLSDPFRANRQIQAALAELAKLLEP
jgi:RNA polymerase sigma factor (sigma-70 family)